jgi:hypothetical protein
MRQLVLAIVLAALASPVAAQPAPWSPERITAGWVFTPAVAFGGLWDSNVTVRNEGVPTTSDVAGLVNPRGEIDFNGKRTRFSAGYSGALESYRTLADLTRYDQRGRMDTRYQMTPRLLFQTRNQLTLTPTTDQLDIEGAVPFTRVGSRMLTSTSGFTFDVTRRIAVNGSYQFQWVTFDRADREPDFRFLQGGFSHSPFTEVTYALSRRLKIGGLYEYKHTVLDGGEEVFDSQRALGTVYFDLGPETKISGRAGIDHLLVSDRNETHTGPSYGAGITHRAGRAIFDANYERSFVPSFGFGGLTANHVTHAGAQVPFAQGRFQWSAGLTYRRSDPVFARELNIQLDSYYAQTTLGYFIARWLRMEGFYALTHQVSSARGNVDRSRVGVQFVTSKPMRIQ